MKTWDEIVATSQDYDVLERWAAAVGWRVMKGEMGDEDMGGNYYRYDYYVFVDAYEREVDAPAGVVDDEWLSRESLLDAWADAIRRKFWGRDA